MPPRTTRPARAVQLDHLALAGDVARVARLVGDELLTRLRKKAEDLRAGDGPEALHDFRVAVRRLRSWLRAFHADVGDTLAAKHRRRLKRIADATRPSRDLEVHIAWVEQFARRRHKNHHGAEWLVKRLEARKARADVELQRILNDDLDRAVTSVRKAMSRYTARLDEPAIPFARITAMLIRDHAAAARSALKHVSTIGDRREAHDARIASKRLRYLFEPLRDAVAEATPLVEQLSSLQDDLGALHDAQLFGSEIAQLLAKTLGAKAKAAANGNGGDDAVEPTTTDDDRADLLLAISRRLHRDETAAFARVSEKWLGDLTDQLWLDVEAVATRLDEIATRERGWVQSYLLRGMVAELPPATVTVIEQGHLPGDRVIESVRRVTDDHGTRYERAIDLPRDGTRAEITEETSEKVFDALWPLTKGRRSKRRRHDIESEGRRWAIHEYVDRALVLATVELGAPDDVAAIPDWLETSIDHEVTDEMSAEDPAPRSG